MTIRPGNQVSDASLPGSAAGSAPRVLCRGGQSRTAEDLAIGLAGGPGSSVVFVQDVEMPAQTPLDAAPASVTNRLEQDLARNASRAGHRGVSADTHLRIGHDATRTLIKAARETGSALAVLDAEGSAELSGRADPGRIAKEAKIPVVEVHARRPGFNPSSLLVPVVPGSPGSTTLQVAGLFARHTGARLEILHVTKTDSDEAEHDRMKQFLRATLALHDEQLDAEIRVEAASDVSNAILDRGRAHGAVVLGATRRGWLTRTLLGSLPEQVWRQAEADVLVVHRP